MDIYTHNTHIYVYVHMSMYGIYVYMIYICLCISFTMPYRHQLILGPHKFLRTKLTCNIHPGGFPNLLN